MRQKPVQDLDFNDLHSLLPITVRISRETLHRLEELEDAILTARSYGPPTTTARERKAAFRSWCQLKLPQNVRNIAANISLNQSLDAARDYLLSEFEKANPEFKPPANRIGRPIGFIPAETQRKIARGEIIARLLNIGYKTLVKELTGEADVPLK